jgi:hypothetical protein
MMEAREEGEVESGEVAVKQESFVEPLIKQVLSEGGRGPT